MTNDQKFCSFMNQVEELLTTLDKTDAPHGELYRQKAKEQRKKVKIFIIQNRLFNSTTEKTDNIKRKTPNKFNHTQNWLAQ